MNLRGGKDYAVFRFVQLAPPYVVLRTVPIRPPAVPYTTGVAAVILGSLSLATLTASGKGQDMHFKSRNFAFAPHRATANT
jgi:hypothetical protein